MIALPFGVPKQSRHVLLSPSHTPHKSTFAAPPSTPRQSATLGCKLPSGLRPGIIDAPTSRSPPPPRRIGYLIGISRLGMAPRGDCRRRPSCLLYAGDDVGTRADRLVGNVFVVHSDGSAPSVYPTSAVANTNTSDATTTTVGDRPVTPAHGRFPIAVAGVRSPSPHNQSINHNAEWELATVWCWCYSPSYG